MTPLLPHTSDRGKTYLVPMNPLPRVSNRPILSNRPHFQKATVINLRGVIACLALAMATNAHAHSGGDAVGGFVSGFTHPSWPIALWSPWSPLVYGAHFWENLAFGYSQLFFPTVMAFGGALGVMGIPIPAIETGIALSGIVFGLMVLLASKPPLWIATTSSDFSPSFTATPTAPKSDPSPLTYSMGFVISTGLLHLSGIAFGEFVRWRAEPCPPSVHPVLCIACVAWVSCYTCSKSNALPPNRRPSVFVLNLLPIAAQ